LNARAHAVFGVSPRRTGMRIYLISLGAGVLVGVIYSLLNVRSPAPPLVALVGLLGILIGEQAIPIGKQLLDGVALRTAWQQAKCASHMFGMLPGGRTDAAPATSTTADPVEKRS
jgi:XapX domain-containing protein